MVAKVRIVGKFTKANDEGATVIDTTSKGGLWSGLSPFTIGPCNLYVHEGEQLTALLHENAWQFSKLYKVHADDAGDPTAAYWEWARKGWASSTPHRYPMGKGARPLCCLWPGGSGKLARLDYIASRKAIYGPLYIKAVMRGEAWDGLRDLYNTAAAIVLRDYDGYDHDARGMSLSDVLNEPRHKCGHAFFLKMLLTSDPALQELRL